jgi:hypothetical protein
VKADFRTGRIFHYLYRLEGILGPGHGHSVVKSCHPGALQGGFYTLPVNSENSECITQEVITFIVFISSRGRSLRRRTLQDLRGTRIFPVPILQNVLYHTTKSIIQHHGTIILRKPSLHVDSLELKLIYTRSDYV